MKTIPYVIYKEKTYYHAPTCYEAMGYSRGYASMALKEVPGSYKYKAPGIRSPIYVSAGGLEYIIAHASRKSINIKFSDAVEVLAARECKLRIANEKAKAALEASNAPDPICHIEYCEAAFEEFLRDAPHLALNMDQFSDSEIGAITRFVNIITKDDDTLSEYILNTKLPKK